MTAQQAREREMRTVRRPRRWLLWAIAAVAMAGAVAAACGGSASNGSSSDAVVRDSTVRDIEEILDGPIQIIDLTETSAVVRAETSVPVVCSVVYGTDTGYGSQATDLDMAGTGHESHAPRLRGLLPDTTYHYRLQGTASDGTFFASEDLTFRTPAAATTAASGSAASGSAEGTAASGSAEEAAEGAATVAPEPAAEGSAEEAAGEAAAVATEPAAEGAAGVNVAGAAAGARIVEVSSSFGSGETWGGAKAIDEDPTTAWSSAGDGDGAFLTVELASETELRAVGFWTRTMVTSAQASAFQVVTDDGTVLGPFTIPAADQLYVFPVSARSLRLRFEVITSSGGNTGAVEVAAFGVGE